MARSFSLVDHKVAEAEFFLRKMDEVDFDLFELNCYVSAFAAAARSVTFSLQAVLSHADGFDDWYREQQDRLKKDEIARFFHQLRTKLQYVGDNVASLGVGGPGKKPRFYFQPSPDVPEVPRADVVSASRHYLTTLLEILFECYERFGRLIDAHQYYTEENFSRLGKAIEDAEEELGFPRGWTDSGDPDELVYRWHALRGQVAGCEINDLFDQYPGKAVEFPPPPPPYVPKKESKAEWRLARNRRFWERQKEDGECG